MPFPSLIPSSRQFKPSQFPVSRQKMMAGNQQAMLYANTAYKAQLRLRYANRTLADVERFLDHYDGLNGTQTSFQFTSEWNKQVWGGWDAQSGDAAVIATESQWRYQAAPRLTQVKRGIGTIEVNLVQVPGSKSVLENPAVNSPGKPCSGGGGNSLCGPQPEIPPYAASCGWTTTRVRMLDGADAYWDWNDRYNGTGTTSFNFVKNNPNKWLMGEGPVWTDRIIDGVQYFWPRFKYSYQILIPYGLSDCEAPFNPSNEEQGIWQTVTPCLLRQQSDNGSGGRYNPESEFFTGPVEHTPLPPLRRKNQSMYLWPVLYVQEEPPWLVPPTRIGVSSSFPIAQSFVTKQRGESGYAFMPGFRYEVWIPNQVKGTALSVDSNNDFIWNDDGQWVDVGTGWNGGAFGGRIECEEPPENSRSFVLPPKELFAVEKTPLQPRNDTIDLGPDCTPVPEPDRTLYPNPGPPEPAPPPEVCGGGGGGGLPQPPAAAPINPGTPIAPPPVLERSRHVSTTTFPAYTPSRRVMKYGDWNTKRFGGGNTGQSLALPLPSKAMKRDVLLDLVYANTTDSVARTFLNHYLSCAGEWADFALPAEKLKTGPMAGWADTDSERFLSKGRWAYAGAPQITSVHPGTSTVTLQLISLETEDYMAPPNISEPRKPLPACEDTSAQSSRSAESRSGGENPCNPDGGNINPPPAPPAPPIPTPEPEPEPEPPLREPEAPDCCPDAVGDFVVNTKLTIKTPTTYFCNRETFRSAAREEEFRYEFTFRGSDIRVWTSTTTEYVRRCAGPFDVQLTAPKEYVILCQGAGCNVPGEGVWFGLGVNGNGIGGGQGESTHPNYVTVPKVGGGGGTSFILTGEIVSITKDGKPFTAQRMPGIPRWGNPSKGPTYDCDNCCEPSAP